MADDHRTRVDALAFQDVELRGAHRASIGVGRDRRAGRPVCMRRRPQHGFLVRRHLPGAGRHLDDAGPDAGAVDPLGELAHEELGHLAEGVAPVTAELEVGGRPLFLLVETGRAHDADTARGGHLGHELDVASEVDRARIDERAHAVGFELLHPLDAAGDALAARGTIGGRVELPAGIPHQQMLVHERRAEAVGGHGSGDGVNGSHAPVRARERRRRQARLARAGALS
jgi:hypothetical protein